MNPLGQTFNPLDLVAAGLLLIGDNQQVAGQKLRQIRQFTCFTHAVCHSLASRYQSLECSRHLQSINQ